MVPYLALVREDARQRTHELREVFNGLRWVMRTGSPWRYMPHDLPPWEAVYQQTRRWLKAGVFEAMVHDLLRALSRLTEGRAPEPTAAIFETAARCVRRPRAGHEAATTEPSARRVRRCTRRWTPWGTRSPCWSLRPTSRTGSRSVS